MNKCVKRRCVAVVASAVLSVLSARSASAAVIAGPLQDVKTSQPSTITITVNTRFWDVTDGITIIFLRAANLAGVGYAQTISNDPNDYLVTTIYGDDLNSGGSTLDVGGVSSTSPDFSPLGGEHIFGSDGVTYQSSVAETPTYSELAAANPGISDFSPFSNADPSGTFYEFQTVVPIAAVPEPMSIAGLMGVAGIAMLRRRSRA